MALDATEHAAEIAGFAAVAGTVIPWSVSFSSGGFSGFVVLRFVFGSLRFVFGARATNMTRTAFPVTAVGARYGGDLARMATLWLVAAALLVVALVLGIVLFVAGDRLVTGPFDPVRIMGILCLFMAFSLSGAAWLLWQNGSRTPIPVGIIALYFFGGGLLTIDRSHAGHATAETSG
jgi:hypothetical protein